MFRKILIACLCGVLAVALTACASAPALLNEVENALQENNINVNEIIKDVISPALDELANGSGGQQEETTTEVAETEETTAAEETTTEEVTTEEMTTAEETTTEEATTEEETTEEATTEEATTEEVTTEEETTEEATTEEVTTEEETTEEATTEEVTTEEETTEEVTTEEETTEEETTEEESKEETSTEEATEEETTEPESKEEATEEETTEAIDYAKLESKAIELKYDKAEVDGKEVSTLIRDGAFISNDIVYYEDMDKYPSGNYYGAGNRDEKHTKEEAEENQVFNITEPGAYTLTGEWKGQIKVDLGEGAKEDKEAKVVLILDDVHLSCSVAPAIVFENVYECDTEYVKAAKEAEEEAAKLEELLTGEKETTTGASATEEETTTAATEKETSAAAAEEETTAADDKEKATEEETKADDLFGLFGSSKPENDMSELISELEPIKLDTSDAGAVIVLAKGSENKVSGSHVAEIYEDSKEQNKLVKQDGAIYSYMTMNIEAMDEKAILNLVGDKEGIGSELHLTINGGNINIYSDEDAINANADYTSIITVNGGNLYASGGLSGRGDAIDSNGLIVINGGRVAANSAPAEDTGLDSDLGTYINGGSVIAFGADMEWADEESMQVTMNLQFKDKQKWTDVVTITDTNGKTVYEYDLKDSLLSILGEIDRDYKGLIISDPELKKGETYYVYIGGVPQEFVGGIDREQLQPGFMPDPFGGNGMPGPEPFDGLYGDTGNGSFGLNDDASNYYGNDNGLSDNIYENYYDNWYEDWFEDSFRDLFKEYGIEMDKVEEYIETRNISFLPSNTVSTAIRSGDTKTEEETTEENATLGANEPTKPENLIATEPSVEFKLTDTVNFFGNVTAAGSSTENETIEETTTDGTNLNSDASPLSRRINFKRFF